MLHVKIFPSTTNCKEKQFFATIWAVEVTPKYSRIGLVFLRESKTNRSYKKCLVHPKSITQFSELWQRYFRFDLSDTCSEGVSDVNFWEATLKRQTNREHDKFYFKWHDLRELYLSAESAWRCKIVLLLVAVITVFVLTEVHTGVLGWRMTVQEIRWFSFDRVTLSLW